MVTAILAGLLGAAGPYVLRRLPEPTSAEPDKILYSTLASYEGLAAWLAATAAISAGVVAWRVDCADLMPAWILIAGVGSWLAFIDWHTKLLPFLIVAPLYVATLGLVTISAFLLDDIDVLTDALIANAIVYVVFRLLYWVGGRFFGGAFGYGDVRLSAVLALALGSLGASEVLVGIYAGFILGAVIGILLSRLKVIDPKAYAFGPYMLVGAIIGAAWGPALYSV